MQHFDPNYIVSLIALVLPVLVAFVTKQNAPSWVKGWTLAVLSVVTGVVTEAVQHGVDGFNWQVSIQNSILSFLTAHIAYKSGIVQPVAQKVAGETPRTGLDAPKKRKSKRNGRS